MHGALTVSVVSRHGTPPKVPAGYGSAVVPAMDALADRVEAELVAQRHEGLTRNDAPLEVVERGGGAEVGVAVEGREAAVEDRIGPLLGEGEGETRGVADGQVRVGRRFGDLLEMLPAGKHDPRALRAPAREPWEAVAAVAHEGQVIGNAPGLDAELARDACLVVRDASHPIA